VHYNKSKILKIVRQIPEQKVIYFGQIGFLTATHPKVVGWILNDLSLVECKKFALCIGLLLKIALSQV